MHINNSQLRITKQNGLSVVQLYAIIQHRFWINTKPNVALISQPFDVSTFVGLGYIFTKLLH